MPLRHVSSLAEKTKREVMKMKRILVVLAALVLVFAVACDGDNPSPSGGGNQGGSDNPGQTVPGDVEIPAATDGELSKNLAGIVFAFMEGDWTNHQASTSSENSVREYYSSSSELVLKTETVSSRDESDNPNGSYSSSTTIQIDGYEYLKKGSTLDVHAVGEEGNLDNITSVKIDDTVYDRNSETFNAICEEVKVLYGCIAYTVHHYISTESGQYKVGDWESGCVNTTLQDMRFNGVDQGSVGSAGTGEIEQSYKLDIAYQGIQDFSIFMLYSNSTSGMPTSAIVQIRGGQYDGTYSVNMSMGM